MLIRFSCSEYVLNQLSEERWDEASQGSPLRSRVGMQGILSLMESDHPEASLRGKVGIGPGQKYQPFYRLFSTKNLFLKHTV